MKVHHFDPPLYVGKRHNLLHDQQLAALRQRWNAIIFVASVVGFGLMLIFDILAALAWLAS
jgi:hypothetical protein